MSPFSLFLLEAPVFPPGYDQQPFGFLPETLWLTVGLPVLIFAVMFILGMGPAWLKRSKAPAAEVEVAN